MSRIALESFDLESRVDDLKIKMRNLACCEFADATSIRDQVSSDMVETGLHQYYAAYVYTCDGSGALGTVEFLTDVAIVKYKSEALDPIQIYGNSNPKESHRDFHFIV